MRSYTPEYELAAPEDLRGALNMLASDEGWRPLAGGTDLMVLFNAGKLPFRRLVSLRNLDELRHIEVNDTHTRIGAAVTYSQIRRHPVLQSEYPLLCQAAGWTGGLANQNQGTLGGNIANASPAADSPSPLLIHDAEIQLISHGNSRKVPYVDFHLGYKQLALLADELIYSIDLPRCAPTWRYYGRKVGTRRAQAISKIVFAGSARVEGGRIADFRIALGSVAPIPLRCRATEQFLLQTPLSRSAVANACRILKSEISPIDDIRSTAVYRSMVAQNLLAEFLETLL
jgi:CO/xanthine dehydrogenase FAD-binding subunit